MKTGIYFAKIRNVNIINNGNNHYDDRFLLEFTVSIRLKGHKRYIKFIEPSWDIIDIYTEYFKITKCDFSKWKHLEGKTVHIFWETGSKPNIINIID